MNRYIRHLVQLAVVGCFALLATGCGQRVEVPPANVGKIMTKSGYQEGFINTSKIRLDACWWPGAYCDRLVLLDVSDFAKTEQFKLFMPEDRLNLLFDVRVTMMVNPEQREMLFNKITPRKMMVGGNQAIAIDMNRAYYTYAEQIIRSETRSFIADYSIAEVASNRDAIGDKLQDHLKKTIAKRTPFIVRYAGLADVQYPEIIVTAQENAAERREAIQQEKAQLEVSKVQLERELQEASMQRKVDVEKARAEAEQNKILAESVSPAYVKYRELEALDKVADSKNKTFVPFEMLNSMAGQVMLGNEK